MSLAPHSPGTDELTALRTRLARAHGADFWRELEAAAAEPELSAWLAREYPALFARSGPGQDRREFLRLMGASLGVMGLAACTRQPDETIVPFAKSPEHVVPGVPRYFATAFPLGEAATGILVESHLGRPTKVEGNPDHPSSLGATDALAQATILGLYDPERSHSCLRAGQIATWSAFTTEMNARLERLAAYQGDGLAVLHAGDASPFLASQLARLRTRFPRLATYRWNPLHRDHARAGAELVFGRDVATRYRFDKARVVVALEADFLVSGPGAVRHARDFAKARQGRSWIKERSRLYAVESAFGLTGAMADERLALRPSELEGAARFLARELGLTVEGPAPRDERAARFLRAAARDLKASAGAGIVVAGEAADPLVHALAHLVNHHLGNVPATVEHTQPLETLDEGHGESLQQLVEDARAHRLDTLVILGGNPVHDAPAELDLATHLTEVPFRVHLAEAVDETSELCHWHLPAAHFLESWSDARAHDGTATLIQPLIAPLHELGGARSAHELVAFLAGEGGKSAHELLRAFWEAASGKKGAEFETFWRSALHDGLVAGTTFPALELRPRADLVLPAPSAPAEGLELALRTDASLFDGRFANNAWLQELPRPLTRLVWGNAALCAPRTAAELGLTNGDVVTLAQGGRSVAAPVWILPGTAEGTFVLHLGYGRRRAGVLGSGVGSDGYRLRTQAAPWRASGLAVTRTGARETLATIQKHPSQEERGLVRVATFERFKSEGKLAFAHPHHSPFDELRPPSLYPGFPYEGNAWGMVIDLDACLGCNACTLACQAENNVPVVGKDECANGREMHWIRVDRYLEESEHGV
ncbi:MAG TPA: molybdopterin oxidoreductase, partial [Planctomycetota bacterium]